MDRDCNKCVYSTREGGCRKFKCEGTKTVEDIRAEAIKDVISYLHEYDIIDCNCCTENNRCDRDCWDVIAEQMKEKDNGK